MTQALNMIKAVAAWVGFIGALVCLVVAPQYVIPLCAISISASLLPSA